MSNLNAVICTARNPEISYFDAEHLIVGGITGITMIILLGGLETYLARRKRAESDLHRRIRDLDVLYTIGRASTQSLELQERLDNAVEATITALDVEACGIYLLEPDGRTLTMCAHRGLSDEFVKSAGKINLGEGVSGRAAAEKKPVVLNVQDYLSERLAPFIVQEGFQILASTPLISAGELVGALNLGMRRPRDFPPEELRLLEAIGQLLGQAVRNVRLHESVRQELAERQRVEEALRVAATNVEKEKARTEAIIAGIGDGISIQDRDYRIIYQNQVQKDLVGDHVGEFCYAAYESRDQDCEGCPLTLSFRDGGIHTAERTGSVNGKTIYVETTASPLKDPSGNIVAGIEVVRDISERKRAERQISKGLKMLSALRKVDQNILCGANVRETLGVICETIVDMGYRLCWVGMAEPDYSVRVAAVRGVEEGALADVIIRWDDTPQGCGPSGTVIKTGQTYISQNILENNRLAPWKDKVLEWGLCSLVSLPLKSNEGDVLGVLHVYSDQGNRFAPEDISDLETFAQQCTVALVSAKGIDDLRDANQRLTFHVNRMPLGYIVWNKEFRVVEWNPAAERIFGWKSDEAVGKHPYGFIVPAEAQPHVVGVWSKLLEGDESSYSLNVNIRKDGKTITCEWFNTPLRAASGQVAGVLSMVHDITEKTQLEMQLQTAQRMEAIGTLAGGIAHDFNNALTGIVGFGEMLKLQLAANERASSSIDEILRCAERASTLTRQLLTYARRQIIEPVNLSMNKVITDLMKLVSKVVGEHIEIRTFLAKDLPVVRADVGQIEQVVMNLILNARDAMPGGGQLLMETGLVHLNAEYVRYHPYMKVGSYVVLTVSDTGIGMDQKTQERVFEPFFTTKGPDKGTGLGLSMVYGIVKQHNGFIHLYSEPGKGTTFKIYFLPLEADPDVVVSSRPSEIRVGTETILLAEDDESIRMLVDRTLTELGYTVLSARNGEDAIAVFRENTERISLALLDVVMPVKGGKEAYEYMHKVEPELKVIFMSGYTANAVHESFVLIAGVPFLAKPFGPGTLARKVREVLDRK